MNLNVDADEIYERFASASIRSAAKKATGKFTRSADGEMYYAYTIFSRCRTKKRATC